MSLECLYGSNSLARVTINSSLRLLKGSFSLFLRPYKAVLLRNWWSALSLLLGTADFSLEALVGGHVHKPALAVGARFHVGKSRPYNCLAGQTSAVSQVPSWSAVVWRAAVSFRVRSKILPLYWLLRNRQNLDAS